MENENKVRVNTMIYPHLKERLESKDISMAFALETGAKILVGYPDKLSLRQLQEINRNDIDILQSRIDGIQDDISRILEYIEEIKGFLGMTNG